MIKALALLTLTFLSANVFASAYTETISMQDNHYGYESADLLQLSKLESKELLALKADRTNVLNRFVNILKVTEGDAFSFKSPNFHKITFSKEDIIEDITAATTAINSLVDRVNSVIDRKKNLSQTTSASVFYLESGVIEYKDNTCNVASHILMLTPGQLSILKMSCDTPFKGEVVTYINVSMDLSYKVHVNEDVHFLSPIEETVIKDSVQTNANYKNSSAVTKLKYTIKSSGI